MQEHFTILWSGWAELNYAMLPCKLHPMGVIKGFRWEIILLIGELQFILFFHKTRVLLTPHWLWCPTTLWLEILYHFPPDIIILATRMTLLMQSPLTWFNCWWCLSWLIRNLALFVLLPFCLDIYCTQYRPCAFFVR